MRIKDPVMIEKRVTAEYEIDVEGTKVRAYYTYDSDNEGHSGWQYDLSECYVDLDEDEILDLEEEFHNIIMDIGV